MSRRTFEIARRKFYFIFSCFFANIRIRFVHEEGTFMKRRKYTRTKFLVVLTESFLHKPRIVFEHSLCEADQETRIPKMESNRGGRYR